VFVIIFFTHRFRILYRIPIHIVIITIIINPVDLNKKNRVYSKRFHLYIIRYYYPLLYMWRRLRRAAYFSEDQTVGSTKFYRFFSVFALKRYRFLPRFVFAQTYIVIILYTERKTPQ